MALNLNTLALDPKSDVQLKHPVTGDPLFDGVDADGNPIPVMVTLYGKASKQYRNAETTMMNRALKRQGRKEKPDADVIRQDGIDLLVACIAGFKNLDIDGNVPTTTEEFRQILTAPSLGWIKSQVDEALADDANFLAQ